jgi:hypothetical protein
MAVLLFSQLAVLTLACAVPRRAPEVVPRPEAPDAGSRASRGANGGPAGAGPGA